MTRVQRWVSSVCAAPSWLWATSAWACPSCPIGRAARQQVCEQAFVQNLLFALAPFAVVAVAAVWAERIGKR
ncbi:MAG TPA: hypothetical protein VJR89_34290 [Polyangiales bacterium]|nr:hypothetical protein [Polyangiales bacterium]